MNMKTVLSVLAVLVVLVGGWYLLSKRSATETGPIQLGFIGPLTGDVASIGTLDRTAVEIAVEEINAKGGVNGRSIAVTYEDGQCDAATGVNAAQKLFNSGVVAIIGGLCTPETGAFGPMAMEKKVIVLSYGSSAATLSGLGKYFFRNFPSDDFQGNFAAEYAYNVLGARKAATLYHTTDYGTGLSNTFEKRFTELGGSVVATEGAAQEARDYRTPLAKIKSLEPDFVYMALYTEGSIVAMDQASTLGVANNIFGSETWDDPKVQKAAAGKGAFLYTIPAMAFSEDFAAKIEVKTGSSDVPTTVANAYDAVYILAAAFEKAGTEDPDKIEAALRKTQYDGISGHIAFDKNGDLANPKFLVKKMENGTSAEVK